MGEITDDYITVRTSANWTSLLHASLPNLQAEDDSYRAMCGMRKPMWHDDQIRDKRFRLTKPGLRCLKCVEVIESPESMEERAEKRVLKRRERSRVSQSDHRASKRRTYPIVTLGEIFDLDTFTHDVELYRIRHRYSYAEVAERAGLTAPAIARLLYLTNPPFRTVLALAEVCDLSIDKYRIARQ